MIQILNVGCGGAKVPIPDIQEVRLDIDPDVHPDIVLDARQLKELPPNSYQGIWCSHVLEHFCEHELAGILEGMRHVLTEDGVLFIRVPDLTALFNHVVQNKMGMNDVVYVSPVGPVRPLNILYGLQTQVASGNSFYSHKTGFDETCLGKYLVAAGFRTIYMSKASFEIRAIACVGILPDWVQDYMKG